MADAATALWVFELIVLMVLMGVLCVIVVTVTTVACMALWALVKPPLSGLIDAWMDWFERRTGC
ncbi:hypothetical protein [Adlercreutzia caecimuris]|uniref:hypothetical protein n=1 Tax=Adlercreutzia caecimuris TaxID=671266 RepID=UPI001C3F0E01|nr:hypothetical protein [Adlercreutzia caecimuris]